MHRNEACVLLSKIAENELIDRELGKFLLKARDIVICDHHKVLDVLATPETRMGHKENLKNFLRKASDEVGVINYDIAKAMNLLWIDLCSNPNSLNEFYEKCEEPFIESRCKNCPNFKGYQEK